MGASDRTAQGPRPLIICFRLVVLIGVFGSATARSWDLAVTAGNEIDFIARNGSLIGKTIIANASSLVGIAYDDDSYTLFLSDANNHDFSIFSVDLSAKNVTTKPILKNSQVLSMVYDSQTRTLFWTNEQSIMSMHVPLSGPPGKPQLLHSLPTESPRGIALDACNRHIYWTNSNHSSPSIMRSNLDGGNRTTIVSDNLYEPTGIAVDHATARLYWADDEEGIHYKLERSNLNGGERVLLVHGNNQQPDHLVVDRASVYWTDFVYRAAWHLGKDVKPGDMPLELKSYYDSVQQAYPTGILARDNLGSGIVCKAMLAEEAKRKTTTLPAPQPTLQSFNNLTTSTEEGDEADKCFNGGAVEKAGGSCHCKPGYSGSRCEISACHNYCLTGECFVNDKGLPVCKCGASSSGSRCEITFDMAEICALYCMNRELQITSIDTSSCRCAELNQTLEEVLGYDTFNCTILVPVLAAFVGMLTIVVILLSVYVSKLRRRPRIKKRFVVNKGGAITPLTSRPGAQLPADQCEITIENCCNMNICETPCFEPKLRGPGGGGTRTNNNGVITKKEEKSGLLDHMEDGGNSC